ncbi:MAG: hypothetical protein ABJA66_12435 [Actinomycetota bacterium]
MNKIFGEPVYQSNFEKYETMLTDISQESGRIAWSSGNSTIFYMILLIIQDKSSQLWKLQVQD